MENLNELKKLVGWCGAYCGECGMYKGRIITKVAADLRELIEAHNYPEWVPQYGGIDFNFKEFQKGVTYFTKETSGCYCQSPCKDGGGVPGCKIKECAERRGVKVCFECNEYPCELIEEFLKGKDAERAKEYDRFKELGMENWIKTHWQKSEKGYCRATKKYYTRPKAE